VGLIAGACGGFWIPGPPEQQSLAICVAAGAMSGAIVGATGDIVEAIKETRKLNKKL
jgi:hypothetical protein